MKKAITAAQRRHQDYLRRKGLATGRAYMARLMRLRHTEVKRVMDICRQFDDPSQWASILENNISEAGYLYDWYTGLYIDAGLPAASSVVRDLSRGKAASPGGVWEAALRDYAQRRAGREIVSVSGTLRDGLVAALRKRLEEDPNTSVETLARNLMHDFNSGLNAWQCRRIAQTETMIGLAEAGDLAAQSTDVPFVKQWCISGVGNTRPTHEDMDGVAVAQDEYFILPDCTMLYPHDTSTGAPADEIINCACSCIRLPGKDTSRATPLPKPAPVVPRPAPKPAPAPIPAIITPPAKPAVTKPKPASADAAREARIKKMMKEMPDTYTDEVKRAKAENYLAIEQAKGIKKGKPMSVEKADQQSANPNYWTGGYYYGVNCATCAPAYALREFGFDVTAKPKLKGTLNEKASWNRSFEMWKNADGTPAKPTTYADWMAAKGYAKMTAKRYMQFYEEACKQPGTYITTITWKGGRSAHATIIKREANGKLVHIEPQRYKAADGTRLSVQKVLADDGFATPDWSKGILRVDDKVFDTAWLDLFNFGGK